MDYKVIECGDVETLEKEVNELIQEGWQPLGGVSASYTSTEYSEDFVVCQAMIKPPVITNKKEIFP